MMIISILIILANLIAATLNYALYLINGDSFNLVLTIAWSILIYMWACILYSCLYTRRKIKEFHAGADERNSNFNKWLRNIEVGIKNSDIKNVGEEE